MYKYIIVFLLNIIFVFNLSAQEGHDISEPSKTVVEDTSSKPKRKDRYVIPQYDKKDLDASYEENKVEFMKRNDYSVEELKERVKNLEMLKKKASIYVKQIKAHLNGQDPKKEQQATEIIYNINISISVASNIIKLHQESKGADAYNEFKGLGLEKIYSFQDSAFRSPEVDNLKEEIFFQEKIYDIRTHSIGVLVPNWREIGIPETHAKAEAFGYKMNIDDRYTLMIVKLWRQEVMGYKEGFNNRGEPEKQAIVENDILTKAILWDKIALKAIPENKVKVTIDEKLVADIQKARKEIKTLNVQDLYDFENKSFKDPAKLENIKKNIFQVRKSTLDILTPAIGTIIPNTEKYGLIGTESAIGYKVKLRISPKDATASDYSLIIVKTQSGMTKAFLWSNLNDGINKSQIVDVF